MLPKSACSSPFETLRSSTHHMDVATCSRWPCLSRELDEAQWFSHQHLHRLCVLLWEQALGWVDVEAGCCLILVAFICLLSDIYKQWTKFAHFTYLSASSISTCYFFTFQVKFRAVLGSSFNFSFPTRNVVSTQDHNLIPSVLLHLEGSWSLFCPLGGSYLHTEPLLQSVFWKEIPLGCDASETCLM